MNWNWKSFTDDHVHILNSCTGKLYMLKDWFLIHPDSLVDCELINRYFHISGGYFLWSCQKYCLINTVNVKIILSAWEDIYSIYPSTSALKKVVTCSHPSGKVIKK